MGFDVQKAFKIIEEKSNRESRTGGSTSFSPEKAFEIYQTSTKRNIGKIIGEIQNQYDKELKEYSKLQNAFDVLENERIDIQKNFATKPNERIALLRDWETRKTNTAQNIQKKRSDIEYLKNKIEGYRKYIQNDAGVDKIVSSMDSLKREYDFYSAMAQLQGNADGVDSYLVESEYGRYNPTLGKKGFENIQKDLTDVNKLVEKAYGGWQSEEQMIEIEKKVRAAREVAIRLQVYSDINGLDSGDLKKAIKNYDEILKGLFDLEDVYAEYKNAKNYENGKKSWFKAGHFADGEWNFGDLTKTVLGTAGDAGLNVAKGGLRFIEGIDDLVHYGAAEVSELLGNKKSAKELRADAKENIVDDDKYLKSAQIFLNEHSVFTDRSRAVAEGLGQMGAIIALGGLGSAAAAPGAAGTTAGLGSAAGLGAADVTALTTGATFASAAGSGMSEAYNADATDTQALLYGLSSGAIEAGTELLFAGLGKSVNALGFSKGINSLDDAFAKKVTSKISNQFFKNLSEYGIKSGFEGIEELLAGAGSAVMKNLTYMSEKDLKEIIKDENLLDQFIIGTVTSYIAQSGIVPGMRAGSLIEANSQGVDFITGLTPAQQSVIDKIYKNRVDTINKDGNSISRKEKLKLYDSIVEDTQKITETYSKYARTLGRKDFESNNELKSQLENLISDRLVQLGETNNVSNVARAVVKKLSGAELSVNNIEVLSKSSYGQEVLDSIVPQAVETKAKAQENSLQEGADDDIINNNQETGVETDGRIYNQGTMGRENHADTGGESQVRQSRQTVDGYVERGKGEILEGVAGETQRRVRINHTANSNVTFTEGKADNTEGYKAYTAFANAGVKVIYCEGPVERTVNGVTVSSTEAFTAPDGTVYVSSESSLPAKQTFDHEKVHVAQKTNNPAYNEYESILYDEIDFLSDSYKENVAKINENQFDNKYDINDIDTGPIFMREIAAYINQFVLSDPAFAEKTFGGMFSDWGAVVEAVNKFNTDMKADFTESANFIPETDNTDGEQGLGFTEPTDQEIYRDPTPEENQEAIFGKRKNAKQRHIIDVAKKLDSDIKVVFVPNDSKVLNGKNGKFNRNSKTIYIAEDLKTTEMYAEVFKHEFVHRLELRKAYDSFKNYLFKKSVAFEDYARARLYYRDKVDVELTRDEVINSLIDMYVENTKGDLNLTREQAEREAVADFVARTLFKDKNADFIQTIKNKNLKNEKGTGFAQIETDLDLFEEMAKTDRNLLQKFIDAIKDLIASIKGMPNLEKDLRYIEERLVRVYQSADNKKPATESGDVYKNNAVDGSYYVDEIIGADGKSYGLGVYLDSQTLEELTDEQRIETVREHIKNLGGHPFTAFDNDGNEVEIKVAPKTKYRNEKGNDERANRHLTNYLKNHQKQEALLFVDEVINTATFETTEPATKSHGWLDNNGNNDWDIWKTYIQDKENTIWEAKLKIANSTNGEKILYEVYPINKVGQGRTLPRSTTDSNISQDTENVKQKQLDIILETNPAPNTYQTWVRSVDDIRTWDEVLKLDDEREGQFVWGDFSKEDAEQALKDGTITIYSSYPIENGVFVSTSKIQAQEYSGGKDGKVYSKTVPLDSVAWINGDEGQYAVVENIGDEPYSSDDLSVVQRDLYNRHKNGELTNEEYLEETDKLWGEANQTYGMFETGENAKAPIATPKAVAEDKPTERFIRTIIETGKLTEEMLQGMEEKVLLGDFSYKVISDEAAQKKANSAIENGTAEDVWSDTVNDGKRINKNQIAIGEKLLAKAIEDGNTKRVLELSAELADVFTRAGQVVQAARLLKKMTGAGRLVSVQRTVKTLNKDKRTRYGEDSPPIKISDDTAKRLAEAETKDGIEHAYQEILQEVADQMPATFLDKWNAWRYFAMLSNPKTHIRNVVGNAIFTPAVRVKDFISAVSEQAIKQDKRTKSIIIKKEYRDFAKNDSQKQGVKNLLKGNKYDDKSALREKQRIFKNDVLEFLTRFNSNALEAEDMLFKNKHYIHALAGFLQARGVDLDEVSQEVLDEARIYAVNEAKKATFNDESALANAVQRFGNKNFITNIMVEGVLPFKRTPINIVKRGIEYSPLGLAKTLTKGLYDVKKGKMTVTEYIDGLASGLTGTGIMLAGMFLASLGCVTGGEDDDEKSQFEKWLGKQEYAVEIFGSSYTIDWAAPANIPFFIGVEIVNTINEGEDFSLSKFGNAVWNSLEPITNLSMLSGVQSVIESTRYADSSQTLSAIAVDAITSYGMQAVPSLAGAVSRTIDPTQRSWYIDKNDKWLDSTLQTVKNNIQSKVPGLSYTQIPKIDIWGREVSRGGTTERILENFVSPGYYSEIEVTETSKELKRIFNETDIDVFPNVAAKSFEINGKTKYLTASEYVTYAKAKGGYSLDYVKEFMDSAAYKKLTDEERADVIQNLYEYSNAKAKTTVSDYDLMKRYKTVTNWEQNGNSAVDYYISRAISK